MQLADKITRANEIKPITLLLILLLSSFILSECDMHCDSLNRAFCSHEYTLLKTRQIARPTQRAVCLSFPLSILLLPAARVSPCPVLLLLSYDLHYLGELPQAFRRTDLFSEQVPAGEVFESRIPRCQDWRQGIVWERGQPGTHLAITKGREPVAPTDVQRSELCHRPGSGRSHVCLAQAGPKSSAGDR